MAKENLSKTIEEGFVLLIGFRRCILIFTSRLIFASAIATQFIIFSFIIICPPPFGTCLLLVVQLDWVMPKSFQLVWCWNAPTLRRSRRF